MGRAIGIDFGTTNTVVCYRNQTGKLVSYKTEFNENIIPSAIFFRNRNEWVIGEQATEELKLNPAAGVINFKNKIGSKELYKIIPDNSSEFFVPAKQITAWFLRKVLQGVQKKLEEEFEDDFEIESVVVSVPAKFNGIEREAVKQAVIDAASISMEHVKIVIESTAAAFATVSLTKDDWKPKNVMVYDFGGGTFDVTLLLITEEGIYKEAVVPGGDKKLGGNQLTEDIMKYISEYLNDNEAIDIPINNSDEVFDWGDFYMQRKSSGGKLKKQKRS